MLITKERDGINRALWWIPSVDDWNSRREIADPTYGSKEEDAEKISEFMLH